MEYEPLTEDDAVWLVSDPRGGEFYLDRAEMLEYNKDPDLYIARHCGLETAEQLCEYIRPRGVALCGEITKSGESAAGQFVTSPTTPKSGRNIIGFAWRRTREMYLKSKTLDGDESAEGFSSLFPRSVC